MSIEKNKIGGEMRKLFPKLLFVFLLLILAGCDWFSNPVEITDIEVIGDKTAFDETFELSDLQIKVTKSDGSVEYIDLTEDMISPDDLSKLNTEGRHKIKVKYLDNETEFFITITGEKGADGREVELRVSSGYIQWRYEGEQTWRNLAALAELKGEDGAEGREAEFQATAEHIQWRYKGEASWKNLIAVSLLKGEDGEAATISISEDGYWVINGDKTAYKVTPNAGQTVKCAVTFDPTGGELPAGFDATIVVDKGDSVNLPVPVKFGSKFAGWYTGDEVNDGQFFNHDVVSKDMTLYACWDLDFDALFAEGNYTIIFSGIGIGEYEDGYEREEISETLKRFLVDGQEYVICDLKFKHVISGYELEFAERLMHAFNNEGLWRLFEKMDDDYLYYVDDVFDQTFVTECLSEVIDSDLYVRDPETGLYRHRAPMEVFDNIAEVEEDYDNLQLSITYDADAYSFDFAVSYEEFGVEWEYVIQIDITDIGTTGEVALVEWAKNFAEEFLNCESVSNEVGFLTDESIDGYSALDDAARSKVDSAATALEALAAIIEFEEELGDLRLEYDDVKLSRRNYEYQINNSLRIFKETATDASIAEIEAIADDYLAELLEITESSEMENLYLDFIFEIESLYEVDPDKELLLSAKNEAGENLSHICEGYRETVKYDNNSRLIWYLDYYYGDLINAAETIEEVNDIFDAALAEFSSLNIILDEEDFNNYKSNLLMNFQYEFGYVYESCAGLNLDLYKTALRTMEEMVAAKDVVEILSIYLAGLKYTYENGAPALKIDAEARLEELRAYYSFVCVPGYEPMITQIYQEYSAALDDAVSFDDIIMIIANFEYDFSLLPVDMMNDIRLVCIKNLETYLEKLVKRATNESANAMQAEFNDAVAAMMAAETQSAVMDIFYATYSYIDEKFRTDTDKYPLQEKIFHAEVKLYTLVNGAAYFAMDPLQSVVLERFDAEYTRMLYAAESESEIEAVLEELWTELNALKLDFDKIDFDEFIQIVLSETEYEYWWTKIYVRIELPENFEAGYEAYFEDIANASGYLEAIGRYADMLLFKNEAIAIAYRNEEMKYLNIAYERALATVIPEEYDILEEEYQRAKTLILASYDDYDMSRFTGEFEYFCWELTKDPLKQAVRYAKQNLNTFVEERRAYASAESLAELEGIYNDYLLIFEACETETEVFENLNEAFRLAEQAYAMDYDKFETRYYADQYITIISKFTYIVMYEVPPREGISIADACDAVVEELLSAESLSEAESIIAAWISEIPEGDYSYEQYVIEYVRFALSDDLLTFYYRYPDTSDPAFSSAYNAHVQAIRNAVTMSEAFVKYRDAYLDLIAMEDNYYSGEKLAELQDFCDTVRPTLAGEDLATFDDYYASVIFVIYNYYYLGVIQYQYDKLVDFVSGLWE